MSKRAILLVNPHSGRGKAENIAKDLLSVAPLFDFTCTVISEGSAAKSLDTLRKAISFPPDVVISIGGDGLFHLALQALAESGIPLYVVPAGTGNDFARNCNLLSTNATEIWRTITGVEPEAIDLAQINEDRWFGQIMSTGFDSVVNQRANSFTMIKGSIKYKIATLLELPKFEAINYSLTIDSQIINTRAMMVTIGNGRSYGGGMKVIPHADRCDGLLDVMIIKPVSKFELLKVFPKVFKGAHVSHPAIDFYRGAEIEINSSALAYADGEYLGSEAFRVQAKPRSLLTWSSS